MVHGHALLKEALKRWKAVLHKGVVSSKAELLSTRTDG